jgi:hypothetical protein
MKKILLTAAVAGLMMASCKKDRDCVCTTTYTDKNGAVTTFPEQTVTIKKVNKGDAKTLCSKTTDVSVDEAGRTTTRVDDCKIK